MKEAIRNAKAIIFDLFHTLVSFVSSKTPGRHTSEILGVPQDQWNDLLFHSSEERLRGKIKDPVEIIGGLARKIKPEISDEIIREAAKARVERFRRCLVDVDEELLNVLSVLRSHGKRIGLISNADVTEVAGWKESSLRELFDTAVFSCHVGYVKPEKEIYEECLRTLEVSPEEAIFVGDGGSNELKGAKALGMTTVMTTGIIEKIWPEKIDERKDFADYIIRDLKELDIST